MSIVSCFSYIHRSPSPIACIKDRHADSRVETGNATHATQQLSFEHYTNYPALCIAGKYHCWLQMDIQSLVMAWLIPIVILVILTFTVIEASSASEYRTLPGMNKEQLLSARIMQKSNLVR